jgi:hypothetical protein
MLFAIQPLLIGILFPKLLPVCDPFFFGQCDFRFLGRESANSLTNPSFMRLKGPVLWAGEGRFAIRFTFRRTNFRESAVF